VWIKLTVILSAMYGRLHLGEIEAIIGACEVNADSVILDDLLARKKAKQMKLNVTGTIGILITAHREGFLPDLEAVCESLRNVGFWISNELMNRILDEI
jgi:predicted nucleic acid-binding protein